MYTLLFFVYKITSLVINKMSKTESVDFKRELDNEEKAEVAIILLRLEKLEKDFKEVRDTTDLYNDWLEYFLKGLSDEIKSLKSACADLAELVNKLELKEEQMLEH